MQLPVNTLQPILVTGGTGAVGPRIVQALHDAGHAVRILALDPPKPGALPPGVDLRTGSITDPEAVRGAMAGCSGVIHMAALLHIVNPPPELRPKYEAVNVGGTRLVLEAAQAAGVERVVFFSTIAVYGSGGNDRPAGEDGAAILTEESPCRPDTFYGETKLAAEALVLGARRADGRPLGTVLRLGAVYGSGIKGNYRKLALALARRRFVPIGAGTNRRSLIYDRDAAAAAVLALQAPEAAGQVFNVTDGNYHAMTDILRAICAALGRPAPRFRLPLGPVRQAARLADGVLRLAGRRGGIGAAVNKYTEEVRVSGAKIRNELGFRPAFDLARGWEECIREMKQDRQLLG